MKSAKSKLSIMTGGGGTPHGHSASTHSINTTKPKPVTYEETVAQQVQKLSQAIEQLTQPSNVGKKSVSRSQTATPTHR